jgi:tRNA threonylcarbamoyladenosine biosynthesis protein TsaE
MATCISHSAAETAALGEKWGREAERGLVIGLSGDLGAGKTQLVKGLARGLGITEPVRSPTFALVNIYEQGRLPLFHLDLYRLETPEQIIAAGLEEYLQPTGVAVIEWAERWLGARGAKPEGREPAAKAAGPRNRGHAAPAERIRHVHIEALSETERRITYEDTGA